MKEQGIQTHERVNIYVIAFKEHKHSESPGGFQLGIENDKGQTALLGVPIVIQHSPDINKLYLMAVAAGYEHIANKMKQHRIPLLSVGVCSYQVYLTKVMKHVIQVADETILFKNTFIDPLSYDAQIAQRLNKNVEYLVTVLDRIDTLSDRVPELTLSSKLVKKEGQKELYNKMYKQLKKAVYASIGVSDYRVKNRPVQSEANIIQFKNV